MSRRHEFSPHVPAAPVDLQEFADLIATLRSPVGCPWDQAQTNETIVPYTIEETWELAEAVHGGVDAAIREELGDVLLQVVLHAQIATDRGAFTLQDVVDGITVKMLARHGHVFGDERARDAAAARASWYAAKRREGRSTLGGVPAALPPLERADRLARRAASVGFDWPDAQAVVAKLREEVDEVAHAVANESPARALDEVGDLLFAAASLSVHLGGNASDALRGTLQRFVERFEAVERQAASDGVALHELDAAELDTRWGAAKAALRADRENTT